MPGDPTGIGRSRAFASEARPSRSPPGVRAGLGTGPAGQAPCTQASRQGRGGSRRGRASDRMLGEGKEKRGGTGPRAAAVVTDRHRASARSATSWIADSGVDRQTWGPSLASREIFLPSPAGGKCGFRNRWDCVRMSDGTPGDRRARRGPVPLARSDGAAIFTDDRRPALHGGERHPNVVPARADIRPGTRAVTARMAAPIARERVPDRAKASRSPRPDPHEAARGLDGATGSSPKASCQAAVESRERHGPQRPGFPRELGAWGAARARAGDPSPRSS